MILTDQMGRTIRLDQIPSRIVSIVPSQTELLVDLGLSDKLVGVTKFCVHPEGIRKSAKVIGGTKALKIAEIAALNPDLIIGNKEENERSQIEELEQRFPVWMSDIEELGGALEMIRLLGDIFEVPSSAKVISDQITRNFTKIKPVQNGKKALYLIWRNPFMAAGNDTFISDMLDRCGLENCVRDSRYPEVDFEKLSPDVVLLSSEPYPFAEKHIQEITKIYPKAEIMLVDGEYFSWYGSRLIGAPDYFQSIIDRLQAN